MPQRKVPRSRKLTVKGKAFIHATFNNTLITLTDHQGNVLAWASAGTAGFKGSRKGTPFAAQMAAEQVAKKGMDLGLREVEVFLKGPGPGREMTVRALQAAGLVISAIRDITPIPHDGCRPPAQRKI